MACEPTRPFMPDLSLAPTSDPKDRPFQPQASAFWAPTLWVMAMRAGFRTGVTVHVGQMPRQGVHCPIRDEILRVAGFDPKVIAETSVPRRLWGSTSPVSMYRQINYAFQMNEASWWEHRKHQTHLPMYRGSMSGGYVLTEYGVAIAKTLHQYFNVPDPLAEDDTLIDPMTGKPVTREAPHGNVTSIWLDAQCRGGLIDKMVDRLSQAPELKMERSTDHILDHIQTFLTASIRTDAFATWLERGDAPLLSQLCNWTKRKAISEFRKRSRDAHGRERYGALTKKERDDGGVMADAVMPSEYTLGYEGGDADDADSMESSRVIVDPLTAQMMEHAVQGEVGMARVYDAIRRMKSGNPERFVQLFDLMAQQHSVQEIGDKMGVTRNRAANLMATLRNAIREAEHQAREARIIINYLREEPYATISDICEDLDGLDSDVPKLMDELVARGRVTEHDGSYLVTASGIAFLPAPDTTDFAARVSL